MNHVHSLSAVFVLCSSLAISPLAAQPAQESPTDRERMLLERIGKLEERLNLLESRLLPAAAAPPAPVTSPAAPAQSAIQSPDPTAVTKTASVSPLPDWLKDTTLNVHFDGYYLFNSNHPLGRVNLLRAYDATANNFSINQTGIVIEQAPNLEAKRRWGYRLDLMFGQATEALQGGAQNESRPRAYRNLFQAYGTYVAPVGKGVTVDFGKWASSLGYEGNYSKDQINYSRGFLFSFLPYYHMGFRTSYPVNDRLSVGYWLVNGSNQTEDFNGFKSQMFQVVAKPAKSLAWTSQYYFGREQHDLVPALSSGLPAFASQPGLSITPVLPVPRGRLHIFDTYAAWTPNSKLTLVGEFDYIVDRVESNSAPRTVTGGAAYFRYQFTPKFSFGQRYVRFNDKSGLFSGAVQNLNDVTSTAAYRFAEGFETRLEYRRDFSNVPYFFGSSPGLLKKDQNTVTLGLLWWFGGKSGSW